MVGNVTVNKEAPDPQAKRQIERRQAQRAQARRERLIAWITTYFACLAVLALVSLA